MALSHSPSIVTDGLVLCLDAANLKSYPGSGVTWGDLSGSNNTGILTNGPSYSSSNNGFISLDGTNDYVVCGNNPSLNLNNNATICQMVYMNENYGNMTKYQELIVKRVVGSNLTNYGINFYGPNHPNHFQLYYNSTGTFYALQVSLTTNFPAGVWHYIVGTYQQSSTNTIMTLYKNGVSIASQSFSQNITTNSANCNFGSYLGSGALDGYFAGRVAYLKIYNRALNSSEILQNFNALRGRFNI